MATIADLWDEPTKTQPTGGGSAMPPQKSFSTYKQGIEINETQQPKTASVLDLWEATPASLAKESPAKVSGIASTILQKVQQAKQQFGEITGAVAEPLATMATGAQAAVIGPLTGIVAAARSGKYGTQEGVRIAEEQAKRYAQETTYQPRTEAGKQVVGAIGQAAEKLGQLGPLPETYGFAPLAQPAAQQARAGYQALKAELPTVRIEEVPQAAQIAPIAETTPAAKTVAETLAEQKAVKGTPVPTFKIPEEVPPMPAAPLAAPELASREEALKKVGIDRIRTSALENNPKEASSQFITSQASQEPYGQGMTQQINYEKAKMNDYFAGIEKKSGGNVVRYGTPDEVADKIKEGQIYKGALQKGYDKWVKEGENLYKKAEQQHGDKPVVLSSVSDYLKNNANFAYDPEISLKKGIVNHLKNQGLMNKDGSLKPMSVAQAEQLRKYINSKYNPNSYAVAKDMKGLIDDNVFTQVGGKTYEDARLHWGKGKDVYENPKAMGDLLGDKGVNQKIPDEKVAERIAALPQSQFNHLVNTLNADKQSAAVRQLQTTLVNRIRKAGESAVNQPYNSIAAAKEAAALSEKLRVAFRNNPKLLQQVYDGIEAGNIIHIPTKYPGAAVQTNLLQNKFSEMALQKGATAVGGSLGGFVGSAFGPGGAIAGAGAGAVGGEAIGSKLTSGMRTTRQIKQLEKEIKQIKLSDIGKE